MLRVTSGPEPKSWFPGNRQPSTLFNWTGKLYTWQCLLIYWDGITGYLATALEQDRMGPCPNSILTLVEWHDFSDWNISATMRGINVKLWRDIMVLWWCDQWWWSIIGWLLLFLNKILDGLSLELVYVIQDCSQHPRWLKNLCSSFWFCGDNLPWFWSGSNTT